MKPSPVGTQRLFKNIRDVKHPRVKVKMIENGKSKWVYRARLTASTPTGKHTHHKDRNTLNDSKENLAALTPAEHGREHRMNPPKGMPRDLSAKELASKYTVGLNVAARWKRELGIPRKSLAILDEFSNLPVSRQRKMQMRYKRDGLCLVCGRARNGKNYCLKHAVDYRERQRKRVGSVRKNKCLTRSLEKGV